MALPPPRLSGSGSSRPAGNRSGLPAPRPAVAPKSSLPPPRKEVPFQMPDMRKPLLYGGGVLGILLLVALAWSMWPKILFSFEKSPTIDQARAQLLKQIPSALPVYVGMKSVDDVSPQGTSDGGVTFQFSATAQTNETLYERKSMTTADEVKALKLSDRLNDLEKRNAALPDNLRVNEALVDALPPFSVVTTQAGQTAQVKGTLRATKGSDAWNWTSPQFDSPPSGLFPGTLDDGSMQSADKVRVAVSQRLDLFEQHLTMAEGNYQRLQRQQAEIAAKAKEDADRKAKAIAELSPGNSFTGALVQGGNRPSQVNLRITVNQYDGQMIEGVLSDVDHPGVQRIFTGALQERNGPDNTRQYRLNFTLGNDDGVAQLAGSPDIFRKNNRYDDSVLIGDDGSLRNSSPFNRYTLFKDAPGTTPVPPPPFGAAPSGSSTNSTAATPPDASQVNPAAQSPTPNVPAPNATPPPAPWPAQTQAAPVETPQAPPPAAPPPPVERGPAMYTVGNFPEGNLYSIPDLASLAGQRLNNAWLYGTLVLKNKDGHVWTFHTYRVATGISLDVFGGEGGTVVEVEFPNDSFPQVHEGQLFKVGQESPLQLLSVHKSADGTLTAKTRFRLKL